MTKAGDDGLSPDTPRQDGVGVSTSTPIGMTPSTIVTLAAISGVRWRRRLPGSSCRIPAGGDGVGIGRGWRVSHRDDNNQFLGRIRPPEVMSCRVIETRIRMAASSETYRRR